MENTQVNSDLSSKFVVNFSQIMEKLPRNWLIGGGLIERILIFKPKNTNIYYP